VKRRREIDERRGDDGLFEWRRKRPGKLPDVTLDDRRREIAANVEI
jgi:hypothetical protein